VPLPLLFEVGTTSSAFVLCMFHGPQYVSSAASLPGGVKLPVTSKRIGSSTTSSRRPRSPRHYQSFSALKKQ
jgi:hypothetical protein